MGVPKFYRWISERYACLSEIINESEIPEFDNLYLDMNGIIHNCSHPNDDDITFRISEDEIFENIFAYIEKLYKLIRPQKVFFMAVDGVAPRAKMNQQRSRRFMSARTAQTQLQQAIKKGKILPTEKRFDSNCITPGTYFMTRLHEELDKWISTKVESDPLWQGRIIILSGHNVPGEGEHKIMDYIRTERSKSGYDPNTRHCMYGLDADLVMLGIVSHEPHFSLLREEVNFNTRPRKNPKESKRPKRTDSDTKTFHLLHLSLLREYLAWEFADVKDSLPFAYDMERIVDDWILMGLLVGNDFLPHLPNVHIHDDALPLLYSTYKKVLPSLEGYINESGYLNLSRFEKFLAQLALNDKNHFMDKLEDEQFLKSKKIAKSGGFDSEEASAEESLVPFESSDIEEDNDDDGEEKESKTNDEDDAAFVSDHEEEDEDDVKLSKEENSSSASDTQCLEEEFNDELATLALSGMNDADFANSVEACWTKTMENQFKRHKKSYYSDKLRYKNISKSELRAQAEGYVLAIQWNLHYYYHGCVSWSWFYPHHYAPFISDVQGFANMKLEFELSKPFQPFEQLLAVLPEASAECLPVPLRELMSSDPSKSLIHDFYPENFETDLNGKRNDWEAVVLIPFINEERLLEAIESKKNRLTNEELARNTHGSHIQYMSTTQKDGRNTRTTRTTRTTRRELSRDLFRIAKKKVKWGLLPNVKMDVYFPGFPTMKHLSHAGELRFANCNVFGMPSRKESMVLKIENEKSDKDVIELGSELCDEEVCIDWPFLKLAKVESIWGGDCKIVRKSPEDEIIVRDMTEEEKKQWQAHTNQIAERLMTRYAIEIMDQKNAKGERVLPALVWVRKFIGLVYMTQDGEENKRPVLKPVKQWSNPQNLVPVLLPLVVKDALLENSRLLADLPVSLAYPIHSVVWPLDPRMKLFGMPGTVITYHNRKAANLAVEVMGMVIPNKVDSMEALRKKMKAMSLRWMGGYDCARQCNVDVRLFARITGTMFLWNEPRKKVEKGQQISSDSKINCGLALKYSRRDICLADYTDRTEQKNQKGVTNKVWSYTNLTCRLVMEYKEKFPEIWKYLDSVGLNQQDDVYYAEDIWSNEEVREQRFTELKEFLSGLPSHEAEQLKCGTVYADRQLIAEIEKVATAKDEKRPTMMKYIIPPTSIFRYELYDGKVHVDPEADFQVLDRVSIMSSDVKHMKVVQGTVIGIHGDKIDVLFDMAFDGGAKVRGSTLASAIRVPQSALFNITFGLIRKTAEQQKQIETNFKGAYVLLPRKNTDPASVTATSATSSHSLHNSNSQNGMSSSKKGRRQRSSNSKTSEDITIVAKRNPENSEEALSRSLRKMLNIKPTRAANKASSSSSSSSEATAIQGKQVSLKELLGITESSSGLLNSKIDNETVKKQENSVLQQTQPDINSAKNKKSSKESKHHTYQNHAERAEVPSSSKSTKNSKNQKQNQIELLRREPTPNNEANGQIELPMATSVSTVPETQSSQQTIHLPPFGIPPPNVNFNVPPPQFVQPGIASGMMAMAFSGEQIKSPLRQQQRGYNGKHSVPIVTDFKPSAVSRPNNYRYTVQQPKKTMIAKRKSKTPPLVPVEQETKRPDSPPTTSSSGGKSKHPRTKKQSRLGSNFSNPSPSV